MKEKRERAPRRRCVCARARVSKNENQPHCARAHTQGGIRTVAIASWRGVLAPGGRSGAPMHVSDWLPTALFIALGAARARSALAAARADGRVAWGALDGRCSARGGSGRRDCRDRAVHVSSRELDHQTAARSADEQLPTTPYVNRGAHFSVDGLLKFQLDTESAGFDGVTERLSLSLIHI